MNLNKYEFIALFNYKQIIRDIINHAIKPTTDMKYLGQIFDNQWNTKNIINIFNYNLIAKLVGTTFHNISQIAKVNLFNPIKIKFTQVLPMISISGNQYWHWL